MLQFKKYLYLLDDEITFVSKVLFHKEHSLLLNTLIYYLIKIVISKTIAKFEIFDEHVEEFLKFLIVKC